jgi:N-ethylmaleimide reductase
MPREIVAAEIPALIEEFAQAARNAVAAGMDGIELHCASGYLINQFLNPASNMRSDEWGGSIENRISFPISVLAACADAIGGGRVGFRIAPGNPYNGMDVNAPEATFAPFIAAADKLDLAYLQVIAMDLPNVDLHGMLKESWSGKIILNNNFKAESASQLIEVGRADAVSFGRAFISNPDLVARISKNATLSPVDRDFIYTGEERGYTDYPMMA